MQKERELSSYQHSISTLVFYVLIFIQTSNSLNNGLGRTPQMGMCLYSFDFRNN